MLSKVNKLGFGSTDVNVLFYLLYGEITNEVSANFSKWILESNSYNESGELADGLVVFVNSKGGSLVDAWAIIDMIRGSSVPITIVGLGEIASAGLLILISGEVGKRFATENTSFLSHQFSWGTDGKLHELVAATKEYNNTQQRLLNHMTKCTGLSKQDVEKKLMPPNDVYFTSKEAVNLGVIDKIVSLN